VILLLNFSNFTSSMELVAADIQTEACSHCGWTCTLHTPCIFTEVGVSSRVSWFHLFHSLVNKYSPCSDICSSVCCYEYVKYLIHWNSCSLFERCFIHTFSLTASNMQNQHLLLFPVCSSLYNLYSCIMLQY
jgi:hypothetical protein